MMLNGSYVARLQALQIQTKARPMLQYLRSHRCPTWKLKGNMIQRSTHLNEFCWQSQASLARLPHDSWLLGSCVCVCNASVGMRGVYARRWTGMESRHKVEEAGMGLFAHKADRHAGMQAQLSDMVKRGVQSDRYAFEDCTQDMHAGRRIISSSAGSDFCRQPGKTRMTEV